MQTIKRYIVMKLSRTKTIKCMSFIYNIVLKSLIIKIILGAVLYTTLTECLYIIIIYRKNDE